MTQEQETQTRRPTFPSCVSRGVMGIHHGHYGAVNLNCRSKLCKTIFLETGLQLLQVSSDNELAFFFYAECVQNSSDSSLFADSSPYIGSTNSEVSILQDGGQAAKRRLGTINDRAGRAPERD